MLADSAFTVSRRGVILAGFDKDKPSFVHMSVRCQGAQAVATELSHKYTQLFGEHRFAKGLLSKGGTHKSEAMIARNRLRELK